MLHGRWVRTDDALLANVTGTLRGPDPAEPITGTITFWPRRIPGGIVVGSRRIALDVASEQRRLVLDGAVGLPPHPAGITLRGRLSGATGAEDVAVSIDPVQLLELWFRLNLPY